MKESACPIPLPSNKAGLEALKALLAHRSLLPSLEAIHEHAGDAFRINLFGFQAIFMVGPESNRPILVTERDKFHWRNERDAVTDLLQHGLLVEDGEKHQCLRDMMNPLLHRRQVQQHIGQMCQYTDMVLDSWQDGQEVDMLVEMRRVALLILMGTLFGVDFEPDMERMWKPILKSIDYISPSVEMVWSNAPRFGYKKPLKELDLYLYSLIRERREQIGGKVEPSDQDDLLTRLVKTPDLTDSLIRDQLLTMLIAGHDTSTAMLSWTFYLLGRHPDIMARLQAEVDEILAGNGPNEDTTDCLPYLDQVIKETLRLYPPIHIGNRRSTEKLVINGFEIPKDKRVMYSIYLAHRDPKYWTNAEEFRPERFELGNKDEKLPPFTYLPFGGGPRNCIGAAFAQVEARVVVSRILQKFSLELLTEEVRTHMGATLEPRPGVMMRVTSRNKKHG